jgi:hypothetical protein
MAFPTTPVLDDFSPDDSHPMTGWTDDYNGIDAVSGVALNAYAGDVSISSWNTDYTPNNIEGYFTITVRDTTDDVIAALMMGGSSGNRYDLSIQYSSGVAKAFVDKILSDAWDSTVANITTTINDGDAFGMSVIGTNLRVYRKPSGGSWGQIGTTYTVAELGVYRMALGINGSTTLRIDDFGGGTSVSSFPKTPVLDDFSPDDSHPMTGWSDITNGIDAVSGVARNATAPALSLSAWSTTYSADNMEGYFTIATRSTTDGEIARIWIVDQDGTGYALGVGYDGGSPLAQIQGMIDGEDDSVIETIDTTINNGDAFGLSVIGATVRAYRKPSGGSWGQIGSDHTVTQQSVTTLALEIVNTTLRIDDFGGGTSDSSLSLTPTIGSLTAAGVASRNDQGMFPQSMVAI